MSSTGWGRVKLKVRFRVRVSVRVRVRVRVRARDVNKTMRPTERIQNTTELGLGLG
jgi:hypothetical protein